MQPLALDSGGCANTAAYFSRKPLLKHRVQTQERRARCACGRALQLNPQGSDSHKRFVVSAVAATEAPTKGNLRKRKQRVEPLLVVEDISKTHDGQRYLFEHVDFTVNRGDRLALVGPNGAGKSSLFKLLSGDLMFSALHYNEHTCFTCTCTALCLQRIEQASMLQARTSQTLELSSLVKA